MTFVDTLTLLFLAAVAFSLLADQLKVPYPSALVVGGLLLILVPGVGQLRLDPPVVLDVFLPPLLFEAALNAYWRELRRDRLLIAALAILLVFLTTTAVAGVALILFPGIPVWVALVLGAVLSPSDSAAPVAVLARLRVSPRVIAVITGESVMNDTASILLYKTAIVAALTGAPDLRHALGTLVFSDLGGLVLGTFVGFLGAWLVRVAVNHLTYSLLTVALSYLSYLGAERLGMSGVLAAATAGAVCSLRALPRVPPQFRVYGGFVWEVVIFVLNALGFVLIGLQLPAVLADLSFYKPEALAIYGLAICATVVAARLLFLAAFELVERRFRPASSLSWRDSVVIGWSGARGIVSLAASLALPLTREGSVFPYRDLILFLTFTVILFSLVVQVPSLPLLVRRMRMTGNMGGGEEALARTAAAQAALEEIDRLAEILELPNGTREHLRAEVGDRLRAVGQSTAGRPAGALEIARLRIIDSERGALIALRRSRQIGDDVLQKLIHELDIAELALMRETE